MKGVEWILSLAGRAAELVVHAWWQMDWLDVSHVEKGVQSDDFCPVKIYGPSSQNA